MCREGGLGANGLGLTQECFNQDVLRFDAADAQERYAGQMGGEIEDPTDYIGSNPSKRCDGPDAAIKLEAPQIWSPPGSCCYAGGDCGNSNTSRAQNVRFMFPGPQAGPVYTIRVVLPAGLSCTQTAPCALQWTYMTGNSWDSYPEVFRNCADFYIAGVTGVGSPQTAATHAPTSGATQAATPEPEPEAEPATSAPATPTAVTPTPSNPSPAVATPAPTSGATQAATPAPTLAPATSAPAPATPTPATGGGGGGSTACCMDITCSNKWGDWTSYSQQNCEGSSGTWCATCGDGGSLSQTEVGKVNRHRFRGARGSSMMEEEAELGTHDGPLFETDEPQDEL